MGILEVKNLTHSFGDKILYKNATFELFKGEHMGITGQNGTGKTTLLRSIIGDLTPDSGDIRWQKGIKIGYLDQQANINQNLHIFEYLKTAFSDLYEVEKELNKIYNDMASSSDEKLYEKASDYQNLLVNRGFYEIESTILKVSAGLGINALGMDTPIKNLSGGQRAKVILAKLLLENPDVLLLDEPTNFLDKEHIDWLSEFLKSFKGTFMLISHDFSFLDKVTNCILDIEFQQVNKYNGNFSKFLEVKGFRRENYIREFQAQQKEIKKQEEFIAKNRVRASTAKQAQARIKKLEKMDKIPPPQSPPKPTFKLVSLPISHQKALKVHSLEIGYDKVLLPKISFEVKMAEKVVITGFNGIGKSTLIKTLMKKIPAISGTFKFADYVKIAYFDQDLSWKDPNMTPLEIISEKFPKMSITEVRKKLAACSVMAKNVTQKISTLSGGEQAKVKLCILANTKSNFLILDEPTNHLDAQTKDVLKQQLLEWEGNLILVSHEANFYKEIADKIINLKN
ncbi:MAG: ABC-F family ATP-binding cassette domain-containing protein [Clostridia bacterium]|nr:ABC-F family ATP-binding cassette domain-containing protein [Clostridia bacterium]